MGQNLSALTICRALSTIHLAIYSVHSEHLQNLLRFCFVIHVMCIGHLEMKPVSSGQAMHRLTLSSDEWQILSSHLGKIEQRMDFTLPEFSLIPFQYHRWEKMFCDPCIYFITQLEAILKMDKMKHKIEYKGFRKKICGL